MQSKMVLSGHRFRVRHQFPHGREELALALLGGYTDQRTTVILFRYPIDGSAEPQDGMMEIVNKGRSVRPVVDERIMLDVESGDWNRYADLAIGTEFALGGKRWVKLDPDDVAQLLRRPLYAH